MGCGPWGHKESNTTEQLDFHFSLLFFLWLFVKPPQPFCLLDFFFGMVLFTVSCTVLQTSAHCFLGLISWIYSSPPLYIHKGFKLYLAGLVVFPTFFSLSLNFAMRSWWSEPQSALGLVFANYTASPSSATNNVINLISVLTTWWCLCVKSSFVLLKKGVCYDQCILLAEFC